MSAARRTRFGPYRSGNRRRTRSSGYSCDDRSGRRRCPARPVTRVGLPGGAEIPRPTRRRLPDGRGKPLKLDLYTAYDGSAGPTMFYIYGGWENGSKEQYILWYLPYL